MWPAGAFENEKQKENKNMGMFFISSHIFRKHVCKQIFNYVNSLKTSRDAMVNSL